jgi:ABC-2 type transport system permease protein/sodium transport system permease protein
MSHELGRLLRLTRKELSECLRDRRTVLTLVLMPVLLYPVLAIAFRQMILSRKVEKEWPAFRVAVTPGEGAAIGAYWLLGLEHRLRRHDPAGDANEKAPAPYLDPVPRIETVEREDIEATVRSGDADVGVRLKPPGPFRADPRRLLFVDCEMVYLEGSARSYDAVRYLEALTADANAALVGAGLERIGVKQRGDPVRLRAEMLAADPSKRFSLVPILVPLVLVLMTMTGAVYPAIDLTAGERERGTLEILVAAPIPRLSVLLAKYLAVLTVAVLTAVVNLGMMTLTLLGTGLGPLVFGEGLTPLALLQVLALLLLFAAFFSAVLLTLTSFARSFKEAQSALIPLMLFCLTPGMLALMPGLSLRGPLAVAPLINIVLLARDVLEGKPDLMVTALVVVVTLLYAMAAVMVAARLFGAEAVLSSETSGWGEWLRRPADARPRAEPAAAMLCLAVLFPLYFLVTSGTAQLSGLDAWLKQVLGSAVTLLLFVGIPLLAAWRGRITLGTGFGLRAPTALGVAVALLLGVALGPLVHELTQLCRQAGLSSLPEALREQLARSVGSIRELPLALPLLTMAVVPAVAEELFFRGFLLRALLGEDGRAGRAVVGSAALFALFHLLVGQAVAVERLVPSFLLGLVLGLLAYRSGSVFPGMLLHLLHNAGIVLLAYHEPWLVEQGWLAQGQEHYPLWLLAGAAGLAVPGFVGLWLLRRRA